MKNKSHSSNHESKYFTCSIITLKKKQCDLGKNFETEHKSYPKSYFVRFNRKPIKL